MHLAREASSNYFERKYRRISLGYCPPLDRPAHRGVIYSERPIAPRSGATRLRCVMFSADRIKLTTCDGPIILKPFIH